MQASERASVAAERANEQAQRDSAAQTRPYVDVEIVPGLSGIACYDLRITNTGKTPARNLTLRYDAWPERPDDIAQALAEMFETPRTLSPSSSFRCIWRLEATDNSRFDDGTHEAGMPSGPGTVTVCYSGDDAK
jgi:hypothetical protein